MKKKRLGEVLRERGHISAADLNQAIQDQQGRLIHLGELMLARGMVAKKTSSPPSPRYPASLISTAPRFSSNPQP